MFEDRNGHSYPSDRMCVTRQCIDSTISYYTSRSIQSSSSNLVKLQLTPSQTLSIPYILPGLFALIGIVGVVTSFWLEGCPKAAACCIAFGTLVSLPVMFVLIGGGLFPALIVSNDVCTTGANAGYLYVAQAPKTVCDAAQMRYTLPQPYSVGEFVLA